MLLIGHRGCFYKGYNQNTIRAFQKVVDEGVPAIEFDVQLCGGGELVIVHNLDLEEVSTGEGLVSHTEFNELRELYAGTPKRGKDRIPSLLETLEFFANVDPRKRPVAHLELKGNGTGNPTGELLSAFFEAGKLNNSDLLVSSFNWQELKAIREVCPELKVALLAGAIHRKDLKKKIPECDENYFSQVFAYGNEDYMLPAYPTMHENEQWLDRCCPDEYVRDLLLKEIGLCLVDGVYYNDELLDTACEMAAASVNLWFQSLDPDFVKRAHQRNLKVFVYTVNNESDLKRMAAFDVDGIFTDYYKDSRNILED